MRCFLGMICFAVLAGLPATVFAQDDMDMPDVPPPPALKSYTGLSWGAVHTIWNGRWNNEGYPEAGTLGPMVSLRKVSAVSKNLSVVPYLTYYMMYSRVSVLSDTTVDRTVTIRTYFREIDLGLNLQATPWESCPEWYFGGGPSVRWGQAGRRIGLERRPGSIRKAAWFGLTVLAGYRRDWGKSLAVFFEPQLTFSPDMADRWQRNYPPETFSFQMGILW
jgi:hypothetical protein